VKTITAWFEDQVFKLLQTTKEAFLEGNITPFLYSILHVEHHKTLCRGLAPQQEHGTQGIPMGTPFLASFLVCKTALTTNREKTKRGLKTQQNWSQQHSHHCRPQLLSKAFAMPRCDPRTNWCWFLRTRSRMRPHTATCVGATEVTQELAGLMHRVVPQPLYPTACDSEEQQGVKATFEEFQPSVLNAEAG